MEASKVTLTKETKKSADRELNRTERRDLQRESIMAYIRSRPAGTPINVRHMANHLVLSKSRTTVLPTFLKHMVRDGLITMEGEKGTARRIFSVCADAKTIVPPAEPIPDEPVTPPPATNSTLTQYAKQFAWETNSDSLREFVVYMDGKELELLRGAGEV